MKNLYILLLLGFTLCLSAQIRGKVTNLQGENLPFVSIYIEDSMKGTTSNEDGFYVLDVKKEGTYTVIFQFLGYKTVKKKVTVTSFPFSLDTKLQTQEFVLDEVLISSKENPANPIIRNAIASKEKNTNHLKKITADFYSRGIFKIKNAPKKILGQEVGDLGGALDSTRSGIIYLSETVSKIKVQKKPKRFKERIIASKVSGQDNGISFNQAEQVNFDIYENSIEINNQQIISPIANGAFGYYTYKLEGSYSDKNGKLINKIQVIPKRPNERVFSGTIYVVEDDWAISGAELSLTGVQMAVPAIEKITIQQDYKYITTKNAWAVITQIINFKMAMFGIEANGKFSASYSNYAFDVSFDKKTFNNEILSFDKGATKKDSIYWSILRSIPLTTEEKTDYKKKDSIRILRKSKTYLDSIDKTKNKLSLTSPLLGYTYTNSYKKWELAFNSPLLRLGFNTVQGWNTDVSFTYQKRINDEGKRLQIDAGANYGFADKKWRPEASFYYKWNNTTRPAIQLSGGIVVDQFNYRNPISKLYNTISTVFFERNYMKLYEKQFAKIDFSRDIANGVWLHSSLEYAKRNPLKNNTTYTMFNYKDRFYTSNDPLNAANTDFSFNPHKIWTFNIGTSITFGNKYLTLPNTKWNIGNKKYPRLYVGYRKGLGATAENLNYDLFLARLHQNFTIGNIGKFGYNFRGGFFTKQKDISFIDYLHPNGNLFELTSTDYLNHFNLLDYYALSTNDTYGELHAQHNFNGFLLGKVPLLNKLNFHLVVGGKALFTSNNQPYTEYSVGLDNIGFGKWRLFRVDYVRSNFGGVSNSGFVFGINLLE